MDDFFYLNPSKMLEVSRGLKGSEVKMLFGIFYCLSCNNRDVFINNAENRKLMADIGFDRTPERISSLLSILSKKGAIKKEANGVYTVSDDLFRLRRKLS